MYISEAQCVCCGACVLIRSRCIECGICIPKCYARAIRSGSEKIVVSHDRYVILNSAKERRGDVQ